jgi:hypothetical protein
LKLTFASHTAKSIEKLGKTSRLLIFEHEVKTQFAQ